MNESKIRSVLEEIKKKENIPYTYHHFTEEEAVAPPFLVYLFPRSNHFIADNRIYHKGYEIVLELYTDVKDIGLESVIEETLDAHGFVYRSEESWIDSEEMYVIYFFVDSV